MAIARPWRAPRPMDRMRRPLDDHASLNHVFSEAFTERYRRDGLVGVRVPFLNPAIWRYAIEDANGGALMWRDEREEIAAFNIVHCSGREGWMGPLAVRPDAQGSGLGKEIVKSGIDWLVASKALTIGLETMPRTMDNIGFYSSLGFAPGKLTVTVTMDAAPSADAPSVFGRLSASDKEGVLVECCALSQSVQPACDFTREIAITNGSGLGETILFRQGGNKEESSRASRSATLCRWWRDARARRRVCSSSCSHVSPTSRARWRRWRTSRGAERTRRVAFRVQTEYLNAYRRLIENGRPRAVDGSADVVGEVSGGEGGGGAGVEQLGDIVIS